MGSQAQISETEHFSISHHTSWGFLQDVGNQRLKTDKTFQNQAPRTSSCYFPAQCLGVHHHSHTVEEDIRVREGDKPGDHSSGTRWKCSISSVRPAMPSWATAHSPRSSYEISGLQSLDSREPLCSCSCGERMKATLLTTPYPGTCLVSLKLAMVGEFTVLALANTTRCRWRVSYFSRPAGCHIFTSTPLFPRP